MPKPQNNVFLMADKKKNTCSPRSASITGREEIFLEWSSDLSRQSSLPISVIERTSYLFAATLIIAKVLAETIDA